jgi:ATP-binding cassette subfamily B protein
MLIVTALGACFAVSRNIFAIRVSQRVGADLRYDLFAKIMRFSESGADRIETGSLITRMTNDTTQVTQFINGLMRIFMKAPLTCIGGIILATALNPKLSVVLYIMVFAVAVLIVISMKFSYPRFSALQKAMDGVNTVAQEYLLGVRLVKAFGTYDEEKERFNNANTTLLKRGISSQMIVTLTSPVMTLSVGIATVAVIYLGSRLFLLDLAEPGNISAFTIYLAQILTSLLNITNVFNIFVRTKASTKRITEIFDCEDDFKGGSLNVTDIKGAVSFEDVTFKYPGGSGLPALKNVSFSVKAGESLAIIGPTGSGKSTLGWLMLRFYDADSGRITLDGYDIKDLPINTVRNSVAIVPQKAMLFSGTVADNIRWGDTDADNESVQDAAKKAQADFIYDMKHGFESILESGAVNVSGGQKQRISIARGIIKHAPILILDDATSALDAVTEAKVRAALMNPALNHTVITITQRCTTAMFADHILVLENGQVSGFGTHAELMKNCAAYGEIYHSQVDSKTEVI